MSSCAMTLSRSSPSVRVWSTKTQPPPISILNGAFGVPGRRDRERFRQPDVLVDWRRGLLKPVLLPREYDEDLKG